ncbi:MAG: translational GTPase TypA [Clostridia bacterium]|nr:translational GTPase TypA [Clostridia bacterium]
MKIESIRNVAIIAHVDHGKTTMVDKMLKQSGIFRSNEVVQERVMDSNDLERERGITILSKNTSVTYKDIKINIVDTPGHADFGGEVERVLGMVEGVLLLVDAFEGAMPQTRFVLKKALEKGLKPIVVVNKIDKPNARPIEVVDEVFDLFFELGANEQQLDFPVIYASSREGFAMKDLENPQEDLTELFDAILEMVPPPECDPDKPFQMLVSNIDSDEYIGRIAVGKILRGSVNAGETVSICKKTGKVETAKVGKLFIYDGLKREDAETVSCGEIVCISGLGNIEIGETVCNVNTPEALPVIEVDEPTISMNFLVNNSPFAGKEGQFVTSRHLRARIFKELDTNVSLKVEETDSADCFKLSGRGELHLSILIETMRREGYEFQVSKPQVILKEIDGKTCEPYEIVIVDVPEEYVGTVIEKLGGRKGEMLNMTPINGGTYSRVEFRIPSRGLIGYRSEFLTDTRGNGIMNTLFDKYDQYCGEMPGRNRGSMIAWEDGESVTYGLYNAEGRGDLFIGAGVKVYEGMIVGRNAKAEDIVINVCKKKHATNTRASGSDDALKLTPPINMSLENCLEFIADDELVEVTPENIRLRKKILDTDLRAKAEAKNKKGN